MAALRDLGMNGYTTVTAPDLYMAQPATMASHV